VNTLCLDSPEQYAEFEPSPRRLRSQKPQMVAFDLSAVPGIIPPFARSYTRKVRKP
jgi:hypothetical protein